MEVVSALVLEPVISALVDDLIPRLLPQRIFPAKLVADMEQWKSILGDLGGVLQYAEDNQEKNPLIRDWVQDLKDLICDVEDLIEVFNYEALQHQNKGSPTWWKKIVKLPRKIWEEIKLTGKLDLISERLQHLKSRKETLNLLCGPVRASQRQGTRRPPSTYMPATEQIVFGRDEEKRVISNLLSQEQDGCFGVIPIVGMGGLGKTTLARFVFNDHQLTSCFDVKAWACVSKEYDPYRIYKQVIRAVNPNCDIDGQDLSWLQEKLEKSLSNKKFLIVLDDLWNEDYGDWVNLRPPFYSGLPGSKIIVTTRNQIVANKVRTMDIIFPKRLSEIDCHLLFCEHAGLDPNGTSIYSEMAEEIARKCSGLPLAAMIVGGHLRYSDRLEEWKNVVNSKSWTSKDGSVDVISVLRMSYDELRPQLKRCVAFFAMFPEDYEFTELEIVLIWLGAGVIHWVEVGMSKWEMGRDCFHQLLSRSLFSPDLRDYKGDQLYVMHDLVRDLAVEVSGRDRYLGKDDEIPSSFKSIRHIICHESRTQDVVNGIIQQRKIGLPLRTLCSLSKTWKSEEKIKSDFMPGKIKYIRVLGLRQKNLGKGLKLIGQLILLRYLDLSHTSFERLPDSVTSLYHLEVLDISSCNRLVQLPQRIGNLSNLLVLCLDYCPALKELPADIGKLKMLRKLPNFTIGNKLSISSLENLKFLQGRLEICGLEKVTSPEDAVLARLSEKRLDALCLRWNQGRNIVEKERGGVILDLLQPHQDLKKLEICSYGGSMFPHWLEASVRQLTEITFRQCESCPGPPTKLDMPLLSSLQIDHCPLIVLKLPDLLPDLQSLTKLYIEHCPSNVLKLILKVQLPNLTELGLRHCEGVRSFPSEDEELESVSMTISVRYLFLSSFPDLKRISSSHLLRSVSRLQFHCCELLESFPNEGLPPSIKQLWIYDCPLLARKLEDLDAELCSKISHITEIELDFKRIFVF